MKDLIWDIAKSGEETLENTELTNFVLSRIVFFILQLYARITRS